MLYVKLVMTIPGAGTATHAAELEPLDTANAKLHRLVELDPSGTVCGGAAGGKHTGTPPLEIVPHPDTYAQLEGFHVEHISKEVFEQWWATLLEDSPWLRS
ncbi:hypothetical protein NQ024_02595 [Corynebacterium sp. 35RC1]|nr:hypothetical protein [Corynebacterium sp. 35RC1]